MENVLQSFGLPQIFFPLTLNEVYHAKTYPWIIDNLLRIVVNAFKDFFVEFASFAQDPHQIGQILEIFGVTRPIHSLNVKLD